jgi:hypothetical protein
MNRLDYNKKMIKQTKITVVLIFLGILGSAQVKLGNNPGIVNANSLFELESTNKGLLLPRVALTSTTSFAPLAAHVSGMTVYNTATTGDVLPGIYSSNGIKWVAVAIQDASATAGGIINTTTQTLGAGAKTFTSDLKVNGVTVGKGAGAIGSNTAIGSSALSGNTTGAYNTATGFNALLFNTTGGSNTATGNHALAFNTIGSSNTAFGNYAIYASTTGNSNTAIGEYALYQNNTGSSNTAVGNYCLRGNYAGSNNSALGSYVYFGGDFNNSTAIGASATIHGSNAVAVGVSATGYSNSTAIGSGATASGIKSTAIGVGTNASGANSTVLGWGSYSSGANSITIGYGAYASGVDSISFGTGAYAAGANSIASGAGVASGANSIQIGNSAITTAFVQVAWSITSDRRWKSDIKTSNLGLEFIKQLRPVSYLRKNDETKKTEYGFIAQELEETLNKIGVTNAGILSKDGEGMYQVRYNDFIAPMVKAIQEQQIQIEELKALVKQLLAKKQ